MKKLSVLIMFLFLISSPCNADDTSEVQEFFNNYVDAANSYDTNYFSYYSDDAKIIRVVEKPDGTTQSVNIPLSRYKSEAKKTALFAKLRRYKNKYRNIRITKFGQDYKISAQRIPSTSDYAIPAEFVIGKDTQGNWKIKEESMNTKVQRFLEEN